MIRSSSPPTISRAIVFDVAASPSALNRRSRIVRPSWYPAAASPASTPWAPSSMVACETCWNNATERTLPADPGPVPDDPAPPRGRSRSVSSNTADAATIKNDGEPQPKETLDHPRIRAWGGRTPGEGRGTGSVTTPAGSTSQLDISRAPLSSLKIPGARTKTGATETGEITPRRKDSTSEVPFRVGPAGSLGSVVGLTRLHLDLELFRPVGNDSLEPFRRVADSPRSSLGVLHIAIDMLDQD